MLNFKPTRHHYNMRNWVLDLLKNIEHSRHLIDTYPEDPRTDFELSMLNCYENLYNSLTGGDDTALTQDDYAVLLRVVKEGMQLKKGFQKIKTNDQVDQVEPVVIAQTQMSSAPELATEDELHKANMEEIPAVPKKKKKIKTN